MSIELWAARLERPLTERETEAMLPLLPPERQERLLRIKQSEKRREPLCAYLILRHALWEQYRWRELPPIRLTSLGKPYFPDFPEVHFNLSHTTGAVLVALSGEPVGVERLCLALDIDRITADSVCQRLADAYRYERRGIRLVRLDNSYQLCSAPEFADCIRRAFESRRPARLSQPALEVLAIIAYYQPATRAYVDQIRGVDSSYTVSLLLERDLIEECGRLAVPGRPIQYRTTQTFLRSFGLSNLDELPELPNTTPEDGQLTLEMQAAVERLQAAQTAEGTEEVTEEELLQAAREMAQAEEEA